MNYSGKILEAAVKNKKVSVVRLAKLMNVSRGTIYYWFKQDAIPTETLYEIGYIIDYDFSQHQPHKNKFSLSKTDSSETNCNCAHVIDLGYKDKYMSLLSKFREIFVDQENSRLNQFEINQLKTKIAICLETEFNMTG